MVLKSRYLVLLCLLLLVKQSQGQNSSLVIETRWLYDSEQNRFLENQKILISGNQIKAVGSKIDVPSGARVIQLSAGSVSPGLIDLHSHILTHQKLSDNLAIDSWINSPAKRVLRGVGFAREYLQAGFTAIRDLGNSGYYLDQELANAVGRGHVEGPQMFCSGPILSAMDGQFYQLPFESRQPIASQEYRIIRGKADAIEAVKEHVNNGVHVIKIVAFGERLGLELEEMQAIVKTAHAHGLKVTAHSTGGQALSDAIAAGVDGIEHGYYIPDSLLRKMAEKKIYLVPTDPSMNSIIISQKAQRETKIDSAAIRKELQPLSDRLLRAKKAKVLLAAGSDAYFDVPVSRGDAAKESIVAYVEEGLSVEDALQMATLNAAKVLGQEGSIGVIKPGKSANLVLYDGDLKNTFQKTLFNVSMVIKDGKIVYSRAGMAAN